MPVQEQLYQQLYERIREVADKSLCRKSAVVRLALLTTGILASKSTVISQVASELLALGITGANDKESIERRLRRTLNDRYLAQENCYLPVLRTVINWEDVLKEDRTLFLIVDESSNEDRIHLFRVSIPYRGGSITLAWELWEQNQPQQDGEYWDKAREVFARVASILPDGIRVIMLADRAYENPPFIDLLSTWNWHFAVRCKARGSLRFKDMLGKESSLAERIKTELPCPGRRWKAQGRVYKKAGWRRVSIVAVWAHGQKEPLVVLTDLPTRWEVISYYGRRFWIETGFRNDKSMGWCWENTQVRTIAHHERLMIGMCWATLVALCLGVKEVESYEAKLARRQAKAKQGHKVARPQPAKESMFTMGLRRVRRWLYSTCHDAISWRLPLIHAYSWTHQWYNQQAYLYVFKTVRL